MATKKRLLTGLQPSGTLHIGNYFGALKPFVDTYQDYESFLMVADYHTLTTLKNPTELRQNIIDIVKAYIAAGVDPEKAVIFKQSDIQEHTELAWIFECLVTVPFLELSHAYKDKVAKGLEANAGLFNYPMLMAADILLYDTEVVPVGKDQQQHVEYAREAAKKFNWTFCKGKTILEGIEEIGQELNKGPLVEEFFKEPEALIAEDIATIPGTDGQKMSKSYGNTIPLFGTDDEIRTAIMKIVTDSTPVNELKPISSVLVQNVQSSTMAMVSPEESARIVTEIRGKSYKEGKEQYAEFLLDLIRPMREKYNALTEEDVKRVLKDGSDRAREVAQAKMKLVREKIGVSL